MKKVPIPTILTAGLLVLILVLYAITYQVRFSDKVLKVRLGRADESSVDSEPGIKLRWPWPIDQIKTYDQRLQVLDMPEAETKTRDSQNIVVGCYALWQIDDTLLFYKSVKEVAKAEEQLRARINEARDRVVNAVDLAAFVNLDREVVRYDEIEKAMLEACAAGIRDQFGVRVAKIGIRRISLPERATQAVFDSMGTQRQRIADRLVREGEAEAVRIESQALSDAQKIQSFARRRAEEIRSEGVRASRKVYAQIEQEDRELYLTLKRLDALEKIFQQGTTFFLPAQSELMELFARPPGTGLPPDGAPAGGDGATSGDPDGQ
jgi:membrane protease subunit HflC